MKKPAKSLVTLASKKATALLHLWSEQAKTPQERETFHLWEERIRAKLLH